MNKEAEGFFSDKHRLYRDAQWKREPPWDAVGDATFVALASFAIHSGHTQLQECFHQSEQHSSMIRIIESDRNTYVDNMWGPSYQGCRMAACIECFIS